MAKAPEVVVDIPVEPELLDGKPPKKKMSKAVLIILIVVAVLLLCCCITVIVTVIILVSTGDLDYYLLSPMLRLV